MNVLTVAGVAVVAIVAIVIALMLTITKLFKKVPQGQALIVSKWKSVVVTFTGQVVLPFIHKAETMDISVKTIQVDRKGRNNGLICRDNMRADISVEFFVKVAATEEAVKSVAQQVGCERASDATTMNALFQAKFSEALKTAGKQFNFEDLYTKRMEFRDMIIDIIGRDLNGYTLEDVAIDYLEQTALSDYDPDNVMDADGIRKITELTALQHIATNKASQQEREEMTRRTVDADKAVFEMERDRAEAEARQQQEIRSTTAQAAAAAAIIEEGERLRAESARITSDQGVGVASENMDREVAVARLNRERIVQVETENIERDRILAVVGRDTAVAEAGKEKETRVQELAVVSRGRVEAELGVAEKEEAIKTLRVVEDATRTATAEVKIAEGVAQASFVGTVKEAEAGRTAAASEAERAVTLARAGAEAAQQDAVAAQRRAEGAQAEAAAPGLADVQVTLQRADAIKATGMADVDVRRADADAIREQGVAEGDATKARLAGEGEGLVAKAQGVGAMTEAGREHEEFRLNLETQRDVTMAAVSARADVAKSVGSALGEALGNSNMTVVSDASIVDKIMSAAGHGQAVDEFLGNSANVTRMLAPYLEGDASIVADLASGVGGVGAAGIRDLTVAQFIHNLGGKLEGTEGGAALISKLQALVARGNLGDTPLGEVIDTTGK